MITGKLNLSGYKYNNVNFLGKNTGLHTSAASSLKPLVKDTFSLGQTKLNATSFKAASEDKTQEMLQDFYTNLPGFVTMSDGELLSARGANNLARLEMFLFVTICKYDEVNKVTPLSVSRDQLVDLSTRFLRIIKSKLPEQSPENLAKYKELLDTVVVVKADFVKNLEPTDPCKKVYNDIKVLSDEVITRLSK